MFLPHQLPQRFRRQHYNIRPVFQDVHDQLAVVCIGQFQDVAPGVIEVALSVSGATARKRPSVHVVA